MQKKTAQKTLRTLVNSFFTSLLISSFVLGACAPKSSSPGPAPQVPVAQTVKDPETAALEELFGAAVELSAQASALENEAATNVTHDHEAYQDIQAIVSSLTVTDVAPSVHVKVGPVVTHTNAPNTKFLSVSQIIAASRALQALHFHRSLSGRYKDIQISEESLGTLNKIAPALAKYQREVEARPDISQAYREEFQAATVRALIWKADEVGALAERLSELNDELLELYSDMPDIPDVERVAADERLTFLTTSVFSLKVEIDRRLAEQPAYVYLTWPVRVSGSEDPISFYALIREKLTAMTKSSADNKIHVDDTQFKALEAEVQKLMMIHHPTVQSRLVDFFEAMLTSGEGGIAPLASARYEAIALIGQVIDELKSKGEYPANQPGLSEFENVNAELEKEYGFRDGEYNDYSEGNLVQAVVSGMVAAELTFYASKVASLQSANAAIKAVAKSASEKLLDYQAKAVAGKVGLAAGGRFFAHVGLRAVGALNPIVLVGSSLPLAYDGYKYYDRKQYRKFLKSYVPASHIAGLNSSAFSKFAQNVDDSLVGIYYVMESVTTVYLGSRFGAASWLSRVGGGASAVAGGSKTLIAGLMNFRSIAPAFYQNHVKGLLLATGHLAVNPRLLGPASHQLARAVAVFGAKQSLHIPFIFGSITMAMDVHWRHQGYGISGYDGNYAILSGVLGVIGRSIRNADCVPSVVVLDFIMEGEVACEPAVMWSELVRQYRNAFVDSTQASMDVASIAISDAVLSYGAADPKLSSVQLGHLYAWVSAASDVGAQLLVHTALAEEGEEKSVGEAWEQIQWGRVLIHYAMVSTFSTWKMLHFYKPLVEGNTAIVRNGLIQQIRSGADALRSSAARIPMTGTLRNSARRGLRRTAAALLDHPTTGIAVYTSSLLSNWIGNAMFIYVAMVLKSNSANIPPPLTPEVVEQMKQLFAKNGLEYNLDNIRIVTGDMKKISEGLKAELKVELDAQSQ